MKLWLFVAAGMVGCLVSNPPPPMGGQRGTQPPPSSSGGGGEGAPPPTAGAPAIGTHCFEGDWKGGGDDINHRHLGFRLVLTQTNGTVLHGTFEYTFEFGKTGTEEVTGTARCDAATAELQGSKVTGDAAPAHYKLKMMAPTPLSDGRAEVGFEGTWDCDPCVPGTIKGYTTR